VTDLRDKPTVLIADDHVVFAEGLAESLKSDFTVLGVVTVLDQLQSAIASCAPDVVVLDLSFHGESSLPTLRELSTTDPSSPAVVVLTAHASRALASAARDAGALAFLPKDVSTQDLKLAIGAALEGRRQLVPGEAATGVEPEESPGNRRRVMIDGSSLTRRQAEVLVLLLTGLDRADVANRLGFSVKAIDYHVRRIKRAVGVASVRLLYVWATEHAVALEDAASGSGGDDALLR
jgi:two-component system NarL family response regulator